MTSRMCVSALAVVVAIGAAGCSSSANTGTTTCAPADSVTLPGNPPRTFGGGCGTYEGFTRADMAPTYPLRVGQIIRLAHFHNRPVSSNPAVAPVRLDQAASTGRNTIWTLTATTPGIATLYDRVGVCSNGAATRCALANFKITP